MFYCTALARVLRQQQSQPLSIVYPSSATTYIDYWPDGVELSLLCATSPEWSPLSVNWYKDNIRIVNSDRWRC